MLSTTAGAIQCKPSGGSHIKYPGQCLNVPFFFFFSNDLIFCGQANIQLTLWLSLRSMAVNDLFSIFYSV